MRKAFELAHISAVCYTAEAHPLFEYVDDIQFVMVSTLLAGICAGIYLDYWVTSR